MNSDDKRAQLDRLNALVTSPLTVGGAETGLNLCDMYTNFHNRDEVLAVLQQRFPRALGEFDRLDPQPWFEKIVALQNRQSYVSGYAGEIGELKAIERLKHLGIDASQFESRIHKANDLVSTHGDEYSVKSFDPHHAHKFVGLVHETPESTRYVVNEELYDRLQQSGRLDSLQHDGTEIINGHFAHADHVDRANDVLERIGTHRDVADSLVDDVPIVACVIALASMGMATFKYSQGHTSRNELAVDLVGTFTRIAAGSGGAAAGTALGAAVGTAVFPILGTMIGGTVGGILGSMGARDVVKDAVARVKWGGSLDAFDRLGRTYADGLPPSCVAAIRDDVLMKRDVERFVSDERTREDRFWREVDVDDPTAPTLAAVVWKQSLERAEKSVPRIDAAAAAASDKLLELCVDAAIARYPRQRKSAHEAAYRMFGSFLVEVKVLREALPDDVRASLSGALDEIQKNPNHPFVAANDKQAILSAIAMKALMGLGSPR